jgi:hypothetical protein
LRSKGGDLHELPDEVKRDIEAAVRGVRDLPEFSVKKTPIGWTGRARNFRAGISPLWEIASPSFPPLTSFPPFKTIMLILYPSLHLDRVTHHGFVGSP